jgi:hypothetical protein
MPLCMRAALWITQKIEKFEPANSFEKSRYLRAPKINAKRLRERVRKRAGLARDDLRERDRSQGFPSP